MALSALTVFHITVEQFAINKESEVAVSRAMGFQWTLPAKPLLYVPDFLRTRAHGFHDLAPLFLGQLSCRGLKDCLTREHIEPRAS